MLQRATGLLAVLSTAACGGQGAAADDPESLPDGAQNIRAPADAALDAPSAPPADASLGTGLLYSALSEAGWAAYRIDADGTSTRLTPFPEPDPYGPPPEPSYWTVAGGEHLLFEQWWSVGIVPVRAPGPEAARLGFPGSPVESAGHLVLGVRDLPGLRTCDLTPESCRPMPGTELWRQDVLWWCPYLYLPEQGWFLGRRAEDLEAAPANGADGPRLVLHHAEPLFPVGGTAAPFDARRGRVLLAGAWGKPLLAVALDGSEADRPLRLLEVEPEMQVARVALLPEIDRALVGVQPRDDGPALPYHVLVSLDANRPPLPVEREGLVFTQALTVSRYLLFVDLQPGGGALHAARYDAESVSAPVRVLSDLVLDCMEAPWDRPRAAFAPDGITLVVSDCRGVWALDPEVPGSARIVGPAGPEASARSWMSGQWLGADRLAYVHHGAVVVASLAGGEPQVLGAKGFDAQKVEGTTPDGRTLIVRAAGRLHALSVAGEALPVPMTPADLDVSRVLGRVP